LGEVSPGVRINTESLTALSVARLSFGFALGSATTRPLRPTSVGFGLSYTLPVVVALLATPPGGLVLIENPEAHLHPRGQMAMGELIARAASAGVQVLVETHSDHVLNGLRLAVKDGLVAHGDVALHFFRRTERQEKGVARIRHVVDSPTLDADGRIDVWPEGFFDQYDLALGRLL
jgi:predicted ATPase